MSSILTNSSAMVALDTLRGINKNLSSVQSEISTGKKISSAADNAAIWAISTVMSTDVDSFNQISDSLNLGSSTVGVARAASENVTSLLQDMKAKIVSAQEENVDRTKIQTDIDELVNQIDSVVGAAQFNGLNLVNEAGTISVLSSLDRASDGSVSASSISVSKSNLSRSDAVSTFADVGATDAGFAAIAGTTADEIDSATAATTADATATIAFAGTGNVSANDEFTVTIGNETFQYTAVANDDLNDVGAALATAINGGTTGYTASFNSIDPATDGASLVITNSSTDAADQKAITVRAVDGADAQLAGVGAASISGLEGSGDITADVTFGNGAVVAGEEFIINVGGTDFTYTAVAGDDMNDIGSGLADLINNGGNAKLSASFASVDAGSDDAVIVVNYDADDADDQVNVTSSTDSAAVTADPITTTGIGTIAAATAVAQVDGTATFTLNAGAVATGDQFAFDVAGESVTYEAAEGDTMNDVAQALSDAVNAAGIANVTSSFTPVGDPTTDDAVITISNADTGAGKAFTLTQTQTGTVTTAAGALNGLGDIDVTTTAGAASALADIEGYLQSAIDASAAFGSSQTRIGNQVDFLSKLTDSLKTGVGALTDANLEEASARLQSLQVQQQLGVQALSIANQGPQQLLALFR